jgi:hypothetical protein
MCTFSPNWTVDDDPHNTSVSRVAIAVTDRDGATLNADTLVTLSR